MGRLRTGLGLAVVWNIVKEHGGHIAVESSSEGACFEIYLPASEGSIEEKVADREELQELNGHGEKILIVDDEPMQRELADIVLSSLGYKVQTAKSGEEAVQYLEKNTVDLVILDMIMDPGINGRKTYEQILKKHPGQKAIIASGFSENDEVKRTLELGAGCFIKKPYTLQKIGWAVQQELGK